MGVHRASAAAVSAVAGTVLLVTLLVTWAASLGPDRVLAGDGPATHHATPSPTPTTTATPSGGLPPLRDVVPPPPPGTHPVADALVAVLFVLLVAGVLVALVLLGRHLWSRWRLRRRPPPAPEEVGFDPLTAPRRVAEEMTRGAAAQRRLLEQGSPRNAIVACWRRFEEQAADAGVRRRPWETSAEFTLRVLDLVDADASAVTRLAALFREARFSDHPLGEPQRAEAIAALDAIHAHLGAAGAPR
jgi:hypothetical protein